MILSRRGLLHAAGGTAAVLLLARCSAASDVEIRMAGTPDGARVWFDPIGVHVAPGTTVRWRNDDPGNSHTATAYPKRVPPGAVAWNSDYLLPGETFAQTFTVAGVYDYFCKPHAHAGMVGRIVVGAPAAPPWLDDGNGLPGGALQAFPRLADILVAGAVRPTF